MFSINQVAQQDSDTSMNAANRIRANETAVRAAYRNAAYYGTPVNADALAAKASELAGEPIGAAFVAAICERNGDAIN